jgi:peroxiredoxin
MEKRLMKRNAYFLAAAILFIFSTAIFAGVEIDKAAPLFSLKDVNGKEVKLAAFKGKKAVVVMFIATRCPFSNGYNERMQKLWADYKDKGVTVLAINSNVIEPVPEMIEHAKTNGFTFPILKDEGNVIADQYAAEFTPETFVLDANLVVRYHGRIDNSHKVAEATTHELRDAIDAVMSGKDVPKKEAKAFGCTIKRVKKSLEE